MSAEVESLVAKATESHVVADWQAVARSMGRSTDAWEIADWQESTRVADLGLHGPVNVTTYSSPVIKIMNGGAHFSLNPLTKMPFPAGDHVILAAEFRIEDASGGTQTPLSEVYNHHWLIGQDFGVDPLVACDWNLFFGAGAEMRGVPIIFPAGYGMQRIGSKGVCGGNLHFIRTQDLKTQWDGLNDPDGDVHAAVKNCIECGWAPERALECDEKLDGNFACCLTGSRCPVEHPLDRQEKEYRLVYDVHYTRDMTTTKGLFGGVLDVSDGAIEWNIAPDLNVTVSVLLLCAYCCPPAGLL
jgi:hypothetical protein